ncbi:PEGA domain-containing protein [Candidatus Parcubacteria bacterium]|nr:MAG: PEGA domain-containing protein [Candidatus Parcubacteria bacterium]
MNKTTARITYSFFFLLFFVLTPVFVFYAKGYRYNIDTRSIEKNGAFYVKSYPRGAEIFVDNLLMDRKTPTQLINIKPGIHALKVQKDQYVSWRKELEIRPGETTFAEDIVLFLEQREKVSLGDGSDNFLLNKAKDKYAHIDENKKLLVTDIEQIKNFDIHTFDQDYELLDWSPDNQKLLLKNTNNYFIFDINQKKTTEIELDLADKIIWDNQQSHLLWYLKDSKLFRYDIGQMFNPQTQELEINKNINDFALESSSLVIQYSVGKKYYVEQLKKDDLRQIKKIDDLNLGSLEVLLADDNYFIFSLGSELYIKNNYKDLINIPITIAEIHDKRLLISNGHEIILYNYENDWQELIDRSSNIVSELIWHPNGSYFITEIENQTRITEIDGRDRRNSILLLDGPLKKTYLFNQKGDKLFVFSTEENFHLNIQ